jgi:succinyldiaminopimelate transaminase
MHSLPDFPWDSLAPYKERASSHVAGLVDLSVGTPVDPTPEVVKAALVGAADAHGYPQAWGTPALREAVAAWFARRRGVPGVNPDGVLPTVGSKELVAWLPTLLGMGPGDVVAFPALAYPTYDVGARLAGASPRTVHSVGSASLGEDAAADRKLPRLLWVNSPSNPTGQVLGVDDLARVVRWARSNGVVVASDECYAELDWRVDPGTEEQSSQPSTGHSQPSLSRPGAIPSILDPRVCDGSHEGLLAVYSLSKQSNMAGYRAAFAAGDVSLVRQLLEIRRHAGMMVPWPVQQAMMAALGDDTHVARQRALYSARRRRLRAAVQDAGYRVEHSEAGLYLWICDDLATGDGDEHDGIGEGAARAFEDPAAQPGSDWALVSRMADLGILVAPGNFYGAAGRRHVRLALTATDERISAAVSRLVDGSHF